MWALEVAELHGLERSSALEENIERWHGWRHLEFKEKKEIVTCGRNQHIVLPKKVLASNETVKVEFEETEISEFNSRPLHLNLDLAKVDIKEELEEASQDENAARKSEIKGHKLMICVLYFVIFCFACAGVYMFIYFRRKFQTQANTQTTLVDHLQEHKTPSNV